MARWSHARREQLARERGFASYRAERAFKAAAKAEREAAERAALPAEQREAAEADAAAARAERQRLFRTPSGEVLRSKNPREIRAFLTRLANADKRFTMRVETKDGEEFDYYKRGGRSARNAVAEFPEGDMATLLSIWLSGPGKSPPGPDIDFPGDVAVFVISEWRP